MAFSFEWDSRKEKLNQKKHGVLFGEATTVFADQFAMTAFDPDHSGEEERFIDLGVSIRGRWLVVCYTERGRALRMISARKANRAEIKRYEDNKRQKQQRQRYDAPPL